MQVNISPAVALKERDAEIAFLRNRNLILAQRAADLEAKLLVRAPAEPAADPDTPVDLADENPA